MGDAVSPPGQKGTGEILAEVKAVYKEVKAASDRYFPPPYRIGLSLFMSGLDWVSDWVVIATWYSDGHYWWGSTMCFFIFLAGLFIRNPCFRNHDSNCW
jgi:hypothetical protein